MNEAGAATGWRDARRLAAERGFGEAQELVLVDRAGGADHQAVGRVEARRARPPARRDRPASMAGGVAQDRAAQRLAGEGRGLGQFEDLVVGGVGGLGDLLADDLLLLGQVVGVQGRAAGPGRRSTAMASGRPPARARTWKLVRSWPVAALMLAALGLDDLDDVARPSARRRP